MSGLFRHGTWPARVLALTLLGLVLWGLAAELGGRWAREVQILEARYAAAARLLEAQEARLGSALATARRADLLAPLTISAPTRAQGVAALQDLVRGAARAADLRLSALEPLAPSEDAPLLLSLRVRFAGDVAGVQAFLHALEAGNPDAGAPRLSIAGLRLSAGRAAQAGETPPLGGEVTVLALWQPVAAGGGQ